MIVQTSSGPTNTHTAEIIDLTPLKHRPKATRRPVRRYRRKDEHVLNSYAFLALFSCLGMWISLTN
jgi:hypothetical protein